MDDVRRTLLGGVFAGLAVVAVVIAMMSRTDGDTTDLGVNQPLVGASASDGLRAAAASARADGLVVQVPGSLPDGWALTSATYDESSHTWHLGAVTQNGDRLDVWQAARPAPALVAAHATGATPVPVAGRRRTGTGVWSQWSGQRVTASSSDLGRSTVLVVGQDQSDVAELAGRLEDYRSGER